MDIVVAGHICLDIIPKWEKGGLDSLIPGNLVEMDGIKFSTGGVVANTGIGLKRLGLNPTLIGKIGDDELGSIILKILKKVDDKLSTNMTISAKEISSYTVVLTPADTDRIFLH